MLLLVLPQSLFFCFIEVRKLVTQLLNEPVFPTDFAFDVAKGDHNALGTQPRS